MSTFLIVGVFAIILFLFFRKPIVKKIETFVKLQLDVEKHKWLNNYWITGGILFGVNALFFTSTILILIGLSYLMLPYVHLLVMVVAVIISIFVWIVFAHSWRGSKLNKWKMALIGSSFYVIMIIFFSYWYATLEPTYPGEDLFMAGLGLMMAIFVSLVAFLTSLFVVGTGNNRSNQQLSTM
ncbi:hypothetical protein GI584_14685 [Gracilibacillus salitolerans]|uniref:Uncharacterized protein n=1 Tax=Gracilibacillus salitolerans TaxID=2663022 RepID=A0A5Q2TMB4_9BACI|nr:hypothetical protein [Gracilibacillus salitolerans]QGH35217.1 hypothetical protein GI584_14685 [Gracilibacillus salitolerans]